MRLLELGVIYLEYQLNYGVEGPGIESQIFFLLYVQSGSSARPVSLFIVYQLLFPVVIRPGRAVNYTPPSIALFQNEWSFTSTPSVFHYGVDTELSTFSVIRSRAGWPDVQFRPLVHISSRTHLTYAKRKIAFPA